MSDPRCEPAGLLAELVAIPSVTGREQQLALRVEQWLGACGLEPIRQPLAQPGRFNVVADTGGPGPAWLLAGHLDTVPPAASWAADPFRALRNGRRLTGLGAWDMKAGLAALLVLAARRLPGQPRLKLAFLADEEGESEGSQRLVDSGFLTGVTAALVPEAAPGAGEGELALTLGRGGRVLLEVALARPPEHAALADGGGALLAAARAALAAAALPGTVHSRLGRSRAVPREIQASSGGALSVPEQARLQVDRLLVPPETASGATAELATLLGGLELGADARVSVVERSSPYLEPYALEPDHPLVRAVLARLAAAGLGASLRWDLSPADENRLSMAGIPALSLSPRGGGAHGPGEWVDLDSLDELCRALARVAAEPPPERQ